MTGFRASRTGSFHSQPATARPCVRSWATAATSDRLRENGELRLKVVSTEPVAAHRRSCEIKGDEIDQLRIRDRTHCVSQPGENRGFPNPDAMLRKARITSEISTTLKAAGLTQIAAAGRIGVPHATFLRVMRGEFTQVAERTLKGWLARLCEN